MAGGDMRVQNRPIGTIGMANQLETIDANSKRAGTFTEARTVDDGTTVFLTETGAAAYDTLKETGYELRASKDPSTLRAWLFGDFTEKHQGRVK